MVTEFLRRATRIAKSAAFRADAGVSAGDSGGCGVYFDDVAVQVVRLTRIPGPARARLTACGGAALPEGAVRAGRVRKPEAVARTLAEVCERLGLSATDVRRRDTAVIAVPAYTLVTETVVCPREMAPRAARAWGERFAAALLNDDGGRRRVGATWAGAGRRSLRVFACAGETVDDRLAIMEMAGLPVHAVDAAPLAVRRAYLWGSDGPTHAETCDATRLHGLVQIDEHGVDVGVFDAAECLSERRVPVAAEGATPMRLADAVHHICRELPVAPQRLHVSPGSLPQQTANAFCDAVSETLSVPVHTFDPLAGLDTVGAVGRVRNTLAQRAALATACGLALRGLAQRGMPLR
ncbi:hypothetical protein PTE30175_04750 [Pandoraea terrae]|uniref:Uncharacterized protein n=1 Tax=Pandoraea terrae TaxID=1537710 RepID=A0A5E4YYL9_9BURK|nr:hypothetical protein [Pandoraea terrae]VVE53415.1 hypothetical protein PTE30175_04750 [Pandoraea terrae]